MRYYAEQRREIFCVEGLRESGKGMSCDGFVCADVIGGKKKKES